MSSPPLRMRNMATIAHSGAEDSDSAPAPPPRRSLPPTSTNARAQPSRHTIGAGMVFGLPQIGVQDGEDGPAVAESDDEMLGASDDDDADDDAGGTRPLLHASIVSAPPHWGRSTGRRGGRHASATAANYTDASENADGLSGVTDTDDDLADAEDEGGQIVNRSGMRRQPRTISSSGTPDAYGVAELLPGMGQVISSRSLVPATNSPSMQSGSWMGQAHTDTDTEPEEGSLPADMPTPDVAVSAPSHFGGIPNGGVTSINSAVGHHSHMLAGSHLVLGGQAGHRRSNYHQHESRNSRPAAPRRAGLKHIPRLAGMGVLPARRRTSRRPGMPMASSNMLEAMSDLEESAAIPQPKRVSAYCVAQAFEWTDLAEHLARFRATHTHMNDDVVRLHLPLWPSDGGCGGVQSCNTGEKVIQSSPQGGDTALLDVDLNRSHETPCPFR